MQDDAGPNPEQRGPDGEPTRRRPRLTSWRVLTPVVVLLSGLLFAVSAANSHGTDLRPGRYTDLASLVRQENSDYQQLEQRIQALNADVETLTNKVDTKEIRRWRGRVAALKDPA